MRLGAFIEKLCPQCSVHLSPGFSLSPFSHFHWVRDRECQRQREKCYDRWRLLNFNLSIIPTLGPGGCRLSLSLARSVPVFSIYAQKLSTVKSRKEIKKRRRKTYTSRPKTKRKSWKQTSVDQLEYTFRNKSRVNVITLNVCKVRV